MFDSTPPAEADMPGPQTFERRAYVRYHRALDALWQTLGLTTRDLTSGSLHDLSSTGVGLTLDRVFPVETTLVIRLPSKLAGWSSHLVRVKRCVKVGDSFQVGCAFVKPLTVGQLQTLLQ